MDWAHLTVAIILLDNLSSVKLGNRAPKDSERKILSKRTRKQNKTKFHGLCSCYPLGICPSFLVLSWPELQLGMPDQAFLISNSLHHLFSKRTLMSRNNEKNFQYFLKMRRWCYRCTFGYLLWCFMKETHDKTWIFLILTEDTLINRSPEHYTYQKVMQALNLSITTSINHTSLHCFEKFRTPILPNTFFAINCN